MVTDFKILLMLTTKDYMYIYIYLKIKESLYYFRGKNVFFSNPSVGISFGLFFQVQQATEFCRILEGHIHAKLLFHVDSWCELR